MRCEICGAPGMVSLVTPDMDNVGVGVASGVTLVPVLCRMHGLALREVARAWLEAQRGTEGRPADVAVGDDARGEVVAS